MTDTENPPQQFTKPEAYESKPWAEKINSSDDLWKTLDNAQTLIGRKSVPAPDAPDEEWNQFYAKAGRPESPDKYSFKDPEGLPKEVNLTETKKLASELFHNAGLTQRQADKLWSLYIGKELESVKKHGEKSKEETDKLDKEFDELTKKLFGDSYETKSKVAQDFLKSKAPPELADSISEIANHPKTMAALIAVLSSAHEEIETVKKEYGAEDKLNGGEGNSSSGKSIEETRTELAKLRTSEAAKDFLHPEHNKTMEQVEKLVKVVENYYK